MVTCNFDSIKKVERPRRATTSSSNSSGFRLLDDHCDTVSSVSRNSIYKLKIDAMFDDTRSISSHQMDDVNRSVSQQRSRRPRPPIPNNGPGTSGLRNSTRSNRSNRSNSIRSNLHRNSSIRDSNDRGSTRSSVHEQRYPSNPINVTQKTTTAMTTSNIIEYGVECVNNKVQKQIERMFTDVANDEATCSFAVRCLGSIQLHCKVTSLFELQLPLRQLYLSGSVHNNQVNGHLDICEGGLRIRSNNNNSDAQVTPFHNIAVWSAVKFVITQSEGGAAFLPLITDPENLDKKSLYHPLRASDLRRLSSGSHAPIFTVVMRSKQSNQQSKQLECHAFVCQTPENAIVIAATLYQSLLAHMSSNQAEKQRKPRNQNGVSCVSIASSSVANRPYGSSSASISSSQKRYKPPSIPLPPPPIPSPRMARHAQANKINRLAEQSLSSDTDNIVRNALLETSSSSDQRKKRSYKSRRAPPVPVPNERNGASDLYKISSSYRVHQMNAQARHHYQTADQVGGDIMTRVAIPRSGSFLNTSGLARYKSRATRRAKNGGGGSPLGFSELFNEFRLQENLHSLDEILNAIISSEGMSFNDLKPIYKEFLLKLAVTLTKDELYQRSKSIMRRQKKKLMRRKKKSGAYQYPQKSFFFGSYGLKRVFRFSKYFFQRKTKTTAASLDGLAKKRIITQTKEINNGNKQCHVIANVTQIHTKHNYKKHRHIKAMTSGSDLSETLNETTFNAQNRNSSSGYVSYSECSYNSDACTCTSADRCYCSLGHDHDDVSRRIKEKKHSEYIHNTDTLISCHTDDKCYCSLDDEVATDFSTGTYCDTESCNSISKCYCKHRVVQSPSTTTSAATKKVNRTCITDSLALDYELFTIANNRSRRYALAKQRKNNSKNIRSQEALSVKKSVEMAAVFADVKFGQTTDIKHMTGGLTSSEEEQQAQIERNNRRNSVVSIRSGQSKRNSTSKSKSGLTSNVIEAAEQNPIFRRNTQKINEMYQTITPKAVGATLEDSLGYLP